MATKKNKKKIVKKKKAIVKKKKAVVKRQPTPKIKGNPISKVTEETIRKIAEIKKIDISTKSKFNKFFNDNKETFEKHFTRGETTIPKGTSAIFNELSQAENNNYTFYINKNGKESQVTATELKYQLALTEQWLNNLFDATGVEFSYRITYDGKIIFNLPEREREPEYLDESDEILVDFMSDEYGINIYVSSPKSSKGYEKNKIYRDEFETKVKSRVKQARKEKREQRKPTKKSSKKGKPKRK